MGGTEDRLELPMLTDVILLTQIFTPKRSISIELALVSGFGQTKETDPADIEHLGRVSAYGRSTSLPQEVGYRIKVSYVVNDLRLESRGKPQCHPGVNRNSKERL